MDYLVQTSVPAFMRRTILIKGAKSEKQAIEQAKAQAVADPMHEDFELQRPSTIKLKNVEIDDVCKDNDF